MFTLFGTIVLYVAYYEASNVGGICQIGGSSYDQ